MPHYRTHTHKYICLYTFNVLFYMILHVFPSTTIVLANMSGVWKEKENSIKYETWYRFLVSVILILWSRLKIWLENYLWCECLKNLYYYNFEKKTVGIDDWIIGIMKWQELLHGKNEMEWDSCVTRIWTL